MQSERGVPNSAPATSASTANSNSNRQQPTANSENERTNEWLLTERREVDKAVRVHNSHIEHALRQWMLQSGVTLDDLRCLPVLSCPVLPVLSGSVCLSAGLTASLSPTPSLSLNDGNEKEARWSEGWMRKKCKGPSLGVIGGRYVPLTYLLPPSYGLPLPLYLCTVVHAMPLHAAFHAAHCTVVVDYLPT